MNYATETQCTDWDRFSQIDEVVDDGLYNDFFGYIRKNKQADQEAPDFRSKAVNESAGLDSVTVEELSDLISQLGNQEKQSEAYKQLLQYLEHNSSSSLNNLASVLLRYLGEDETVVMHTARAIKEIARRPGRKSHDNQSLLLLIGPPPRAFS